MKSYSSLFCWSKRLSIEWGHSAVVRNKSRRTNQFLSIIKLDCCELSCRIYFYVRMWKNSILTLTICENDIVNLIILVLRLCDLVSIHTTMAQNHRQFSRAHCRIIFSVKVKLQKSETNNKYSRRWYDFNNEMSFDYISVWKWVSFWYKLIKTSIIIGDP